MASQCYEGDELWFDRFCVVFFSGGAAGLVGRFWIVSGAAVDVFTLYTLRSTGLQLMQLCVAKCCWIWN